MSDPLTAFPPTDFEQNDPDWLEAGNNALLRHVAVRGVLSVGRDAQVQGDASVGGNLGLGGSLIALGALGISGAINAASVNVPGANGESVTLGQVSEEIVIAAAATSTSVANLLPAGAIILAVLARVTVIIPTAATFKVGDGTTAARFSTGIAVAAGTTAVGLDHLAVAAPAGQAQSAAAKIVITPNAQPAAATGKVRITVYYMTFVEATS